MSTWNISVTNSRRPEPHPAANEGKAKTDDSKFDPEPDEPTPGAAQAALSLGSSIDNRSFLIYSYSMNGREVIKRLQAEGWLLRLIQGSHHIMEKDGRKVPVPVHGSHDIKPGTLAAIQRQTGVKLK